MAESNIVNDLRKQLDRLEAIVIGLNSRLLRVEGRVGIMPPDLWKPKRDYNQEHRDHGDDAYCIVCVPISSKIKS